MNCNFGRYDQILKPDAYLMKLYLKKTMDNQLSIDLNFRKISQVVSEIQSFENGILYVNHVNQFCLRHFGRPITTKLIMIII